MPLFNGGDTPLPAKGKKGEIAFLCYLQTLHNVLHDQVKDVRNIPLWQGREVDFIVPYVGGGEDWFEVKDDERAADTGRVYTEYARVYRGKNGAGHNLRIGWTMFTRASKIAVWVPLQQNFHVYTPMSMIQAWHELALQGKRPERYPSDENCVTWSFYVPIHMIDGLETIPFAFDEQQAMEENAIVKGYTA